MGVVVECWEIFGADGVHAKLVQEGCSIGGDFGDFLHGVAVYDLVISVSILAAVRKGVGHARGNF